jgi:hypothetical protein
MENLWEIVKRAISFGVKNADAFLAILVAAAVIVAEAVGKPSKEVVDTALLALLGAVAVALLRDRGQAADLSDLRRVAEDAVCERPYVVVWQDNHWDLVDKSHALVTCIEEVRFTRKNVSETFLWSNGPGTVREVKARWRRSRRDPWVEGEKIDELSVRGGTKEIFSFNDEHGRGDVLEWSVERDIEGQFPDVNEGVAVEAETKSDHPRSLRITWPREVRPTRVEIREGSRPSRRLRLKTKSGRYFVEEKIPIMEIGELVKIDWTW